MQDYMTIYIYKGQERYVVGSLSANQLKGEEVRSQDDGHSKTEAIM